MIEINLLPEERKKSKHPAAGINMAGIDFGKVPVKKIAVIAVIAVASVQIALFAFGVLFGMISGSLEKSYNKISGERQEAEKLKAEIALTSRKISAIDELMIKRFSWARKLNALGDSVTPGIWLTQLDYDEKTVEKPRAGAKPDSKQATEKTLERYLIISGAASSMGEEGTALIGRFIEKLKQNRQFYSDFSDIELGSIKREQSASQPGGASAAGQEMMTFKITCLFKPK